MCFGIFFLNPGNTDFQNAVDVFGFGFGAFDLNRQFDALFVGFAYPFADNVMFFLFVFGFAALDGLDGQEIADDFQFKILFASAGAGEFDLHALVFDFDFKFGVDMVSENQIRSEAGEIIEYRFDQFFKGHGIEFRIQTSRVSVSCQHVHDFFSFIFCFFFSRTFAVPILFQQKPCQFKRIAEESDPYMTKWHILCDKLYRGCATFSLNQYETEKFKDA
jgi:hypothetical protein